MAGAITLIEANSLVATKEGFEIKVRSKWYRSLPLSCIEEVTVAVDGVSIDPQQISFEVAGVNYTLKELGEEVSKYWWVQDSAIVHVSNPTVVQSGKEHTVEAMVTLRAPYIIIGPEKFLTIPFKESMVLKAA